MEVIVIKRSDDYQACLKGQSGVWGCGKTITEALGDLIRGHSEKFEIKIEYPSVLS